MRARDCFVRSLEVCDTAWITCFRSMFPMQVRCYLCLHSTSLGASIAALPRVATSFVVSPLQLLHLHKAHLHTNLPASSTPTLLPYKNLSVPPSLHQSDSDTIENSSGDTPIPFHNDTSLSHSQRSAPLKTHREKSLDDSTTACLSITTSATIRLTSR